MKKKNFARYVGVGAVCAAVGVAGGIAQSSGASSSPSAKTHMRHKLRGVVHAELVVPTAGGSRFVTVTLDRGTLQSVSGNQLVINEGTAKVTYKTVTLTVPANVVVRNNGSQAQLSSLKPGEHVSVRQGPQRTRVVAFDNAHRPSRG